MPGGCVRVNPNAVTREGVWREEARLWRWPHHRLPICFLECYHFCGKTLR